MLAHNEVRGVLEVLNSLTNYRFTALYRFDKDTLTNRHFFDRNDPSILITDSIPVEASYCVYVRSSGHPFVVGDSVNDPRVDGHPKQAMLRSYCGVPLVDANGRMIGSVCHFDFDVVAARDADIALLEDVAPLLIQF